MKQSTQKAVSHVPVIGDTTAAGAHPPPALLSGLGASILLTLSVCITILCSGCQQHQPHLIEEETEAREVHNWPGVIQVAKWDRWVWNLLFTTVPACLPGDMAVILVCLLPLLPL